MDRPRTFRRVRIAVSALCLLVCVGVVVLWLRSYSWHDEAHCPLPGESVNPSQWRTVRLRDETTFKPSPRMLMVFSGRGSLSLYAGEQVPGRSGAFPWGWGADTYYIGDTVSTGRPMQKWYFSSNKYGRSVRFPHWVPALVFGALAAAFGIRTPYRFSLRTMLIVTTLVAVVLGAVVFAVR
jgi:hypothetical protein